ncbi:hypothetical protein OV207_18640 [Corallococcus sp. BB11-1]|uniref:hypothetical protein n=1 Tax=Corallococcus sp. BB11-1 TaxID=2996783 RepID=UPI0010EF7203|nr:hypothetical protein [Corallococcus sp. BB11-1]MCY1033477.1 hypothetical protein [Corallococcus sp. BB11-1]RYZ46857.1 MAG: hypothetical protein EOO72_00990 [Myxococcaceae bacterium]
MKKQTLIAGLAIATLGFGGTAWAGLKLPVPVTISVAARTAFGSLGSARASADNKQYIGVSTRIYVGGVDVYVYAEDASGNFATCYSSNPGFVAAARALASDSYVLFAWNTAGECTELSVYTMSYYEPKTP